MIVVPSVWLLLPVMPGELLTVTLLGSYLLTLLGLFAFGMHGFVMVYHHRRPARFIPSAGPLPQDLPIVTVQLPVYNERYVVGQLLEAVCGLAYPREKIEIQVLDDSTDVTTDIIADLVRAYCSRGHDIVHIRRTDRHGYKAGALRNGLERARGEFIAIFDADFVPRKEFLLDTLPFFADPSVGVVQSRWEHLNAGQSLLTRVQAFALDGHFVMEQNVRNRAGFFMTFNGTAGVWRADTIRDAGNWHLDTLAEDADLAYRAQLKGWQGVFLNDVTSPAELPADMNALKAQQYRWSKGTIETARKIVPRVWRSSFPLRTKLQATVHLTAHLAFPLMLIAAVLSAPLALLRENGEHGTYFAVLGCFGFAFLGSFLFSLHALRQVRQDWKRQLLLFPLFIAGNIGLAVNNTRAVLQGIMGKRSPFVRTPKVGPQQHPDGTSRPQEAPGRIGWIVVAEILLALYCFFGVVFSLYHRDFAAVPFQLLYTAGFAGIAWQSLTRARTTAGALG